MHTSFSSGPVPLEGGMKLFVFIALRKYFTLDDINNYMSNVYRWKPGQRVPNIGKYVLEGVGKGKERRPSPTGSLKFTASQSRHWLENSIPLLEGLFQLKGVTDYRTDNAWLSWKALVAFTTAG